MPPKSPKKATGGKTDEKVTKVPEVSPKPVQISKTGAAKTEAPLPVSLLKLPSPTKTASPSKYNTKSTTTTKTTAEDIPKNTTGNPTTETPKPAPPKQPGSPAKAASTSKRASRVANPKTTTKKTPKTIAKKSTTEKVCRGQGHPRKTVTETATAVTSFTSDKKNSPGKTATSGPHNVQVKHAHFLEQDEERELREANERYNKYWNENRESQTRFFRWPKHEMTGKPFEALLAMTDKLLESPFMSTLYSPTDPLYSPVLPRPASEFFKMPKKCSCGLDSCYDSAICQGGGCYPPDVSDEEWIRIIEPAVDAKDVICEVCRVVLENGIPTVVCRPLRVSNGCTCESPLKTVIQAREKGKQASKRVLVANNKSVARAKHAITALYQQQDESDVAEVEAIRHTGVHNSASPVIVSIFHQRLGEPPIVEVAAKRPSRGSRSPGKSPSSPKKALSKSILKSPTSPKKSPLKSPASPKKSPLKSLVKSPRRADRKQL